MIEVSISRQQCQFVTYAKLGKQDIDRPNLHTPLAAQIAERRGCNMVFSIRGQQRERGKPIDNLIGCLGTRKALEQLLQNQARSHDSLPCF